MDVLDEKIQEENGKSIKEQLQKLEKEQREFIKIYERRKLAYMGEKDDENLRGVLQTIVKTQNQIDELKKRLSKEEISRDEVSENIALTEVTEKKNIFHRIKEKLKKFLYSRPSQEFHEDYKNRIYKAKIEEYRRDLDLLNKKKEKQEKNEIETQKKEEERTEFKQTKDRKKQESCKTWKLHTEELTEIKEKQEKVLDLYKENENNNLNPAIKDLDERT